MNYIINEKVLKTIESDSCLPFFYKFEIEPKEEFASIDMHSLIDEDRARQMAINIISTKIARSLKLKRSTDDFTGKITLSFSAEYVTIDEREELERDISTLLKHIEYKNKVMDLQSETIKLQEKLIVKQFKVFLFSSISLTAALSYFILN